MKDCSERYRSNWRKTEPALVWVGVGLDTSYRDLPAVQPVVMPIMAKPLAKEDQAIALRTIVTIAALERMVIALGANAFAATGRSRLSFWKMLYGARSATFLETPKSWSVSLRKAAKLLLPYRTRRLSKSGVSNNNTRWSVLSTASPRA